MNFTLTAQAADGQESPETAFDLFVCSTHCVHQLPFWFWKRLLNLYFFGFSFVRSFEFGLVFYFSNETFFVVSFHLSVVLQRAQLFFVTSMLYMLLFCDLMMHQKLFLADASTVLYLPLHSPSSVIAIIMHQSHDRYHRHHSTTQLLLAFAINIIVIQKLISQLKWSCLSSEDEWHQIYPTLA